MVGDELKFHNNKASNFKPDFGNISLQGFCGGNFEVVTSAGGSMDNLSFDSPASPNGSCSLFNAVVSRLPQVSLYSLNEVSNNWYQLNCFFFAGSLKFVVVQITCKTLMFQSSVTSYLTPPTIIRTSFFKYRLAVERWLSRYCCFRVFVLAFASVFFAVLVLSSEMLLLSLNVHKKDSFRAVGVYCDGPLQKIFISIFQLSFFLFFLMICAGC